MPEDKRTPDELALARAEADAWLRLSYSSLNTFESCARKGEFNKLYPRRPRLFDSFAGDVGTALHNGYQDYLVNQDEDKALWALTRTYPYELESLEDKDFRSLEACVSTLGEMIESTAFGEYELAYIKDPDGVTRPAIEVPFEIQFRGLTLPDGRGVAFVGFIDAIMRSRVTGAFRTLDIKTHRRTVKDATAQYVYNAQQIPYGIVIEQIASQQEELESFEVLYLDTYIDLLEPRVTPYEYLKDKEDMQEWLVNTIMKFNDIKRWMELDYFPRVGSGCLSWNKPCFFLDVCQSRNKEMIQTYLLDGEDPEIPKYVVPWIKVEIDPFGSES